MKIEEYKNLAELSTMRLQAQARYFVMVASVAELQGALVWADERGVLARVIGDGSNIFFKPLFDGLIIKNELRGFEKVSEDDQSETWQIGAGENWDKTVAFFVHKDLHGLENLSGIPGSVGAAPVQNIGAYGGELKNTCQSVLCYDTQEKKIAILLNADCGFGYRSSIFNVTDREGGNTKGQQAVRVTDRGLYVILSVALRLSKKFQPTLTYPGLEDLQSDQELNASKVREAVLAIRAKKIPDYNLVANNGSFFKNVFLDQDVFATFMSQHPTYPNKFPPEPDGRTKVTAGWLIEHSGALDIADPHFQLYGYSKLVIVHHSLLGNADDLLAYVQKIKNAVHTKYGVQLTIEPEMI